MKRTKEFEEESLKKEQKNEDELQCFLDNPLFQELKRKMEDNDCDGMISFLEQQNPNTQTKLLELVADNPPRYFLNSIVKNANIGLFEWIVKTHPEYITLKTFEDALDYESFEIYIWLKTNNSDLYSKLSSKEKYKGEVKIEQYLEYKKEQQSKTLIDGFNDAPVDKVTSNMEKRKANFYFKERGVKYYAEISWSDDDFSALVEVFDEYGISVSLGDLVFKKRISEKVLYLSGIYPRLAEIAIENLEKLGEYDIWENCNFNTSEIV